MHNVHLDAPGESRCTFDAHPDRFVHLDPDDAPRSTFCTLSVLALFALGLAVATVLAPATAGRIPTQLSTTGFGYEAEEMTETTAGLLELQQPVDRSRTQPAEPRERAT